MANIVSFDPINLRIIEINIGTDNTLDASEIYSEWKFWLQQGTNAKYPQAFRFEGGSPISAQRSLGITYFLMNGWRIRPAELNHKLVLDGNLFVDGGGVSAVVPTLGNFTVNVETQVSTLIDTIQSSTNLTVADKTSIADYVWGKSKGTYQTGSVGESLWLMQESQLGSWEINNAQMLMYPSGSSVPVAIFELKDKFGNSITDLETTPPYKRNRI